MINFADHGQGSLQIPAAGRPTRLYLWVVAAIFLFQGFVVLSGIIRTLVYMSDKLEAGLPSSHW